MRDEHSSTDELRNELMNLRAECESLRHRASRQRNVIEHLVSIEATLSASEEHLRTTLNSIGDAVISTDIHGCVAGINPVAEQLTGWSDEEAVGKPMTEVFRIINAQSRKGVDSPVEYVLKTGKVVGLANHTLLISKDGTEYQIADSASPIKTHDGTITGVVLVFRNVTEEYQMQGRLRQSEALLAKSQEIGHIGSWELDLESNKLIWSDEVYRIFGVQKQTFTPSRESFSDLVHPDDVDQVNGTYERSLEDPDSNTYETEHRIIQKDTGQIRYVVEKCLHIRDSEGNVIRSTGMVQDITSRKHTEEALCQSRDSLKREMELFEFLFQTIPDHMYIKDRDSRIIRLNKGIVNSFGLASEQEAIGKTDFDFFAEEHARSAFEDEQEIMRTGVSKIGYEEKEVWPDGHVTWVLSTKMPMHDSQGNIIGLIGISRDITEQKESQKEREHLLRMLEKKNEELKSIVYISSHDLRSPIVNINGFCSILTEHCQELNNLLEHIDRIDDQKEDIAMLLKESIPEDLHFILSSSTKMENLINGLLQVSRIGTADIKPITIDMNSLIAGITQNMHFQLDQSGMQILTDHLPDCVGDRTQIDRLFMNLIDNAIKYRNPKREGLIHISGQKKDQQCIYCIEDNGIGISKMHQKKIFDIFHRLHPDGPASGQGLGLTIVRRILDRYNGDIWVESVPGQGCKFFVSLPVGKNLLTIAQTTNGIVKHPKSPSRI